jgi:hypothetical protein
MLNYTGQTAEYVSVDYSGLPEKTAVLFVNSTSGEKTSSPSDPLSGGGTGSAKIPISPDLGAGQYYLLAQTEAGAYIAQTVAFYLAGN